MDIKTNYNSDTKILETNVEGVTSQFLVLKEDSSEAIIKTLKDFDNEHQVNDYIHSLEQTNFIDIL